MNMPTTKRIGIIGHAADKFDSITEVEAKNVIRCILEEQRPIVVSGNSPLGGVDKWAEEAASALGLPTQIYAPKVHSWNPPAGYGYRARNLDIAKNSDEVHVIVVSKYPPSYKGTTFKSCYHCAGKDIPTHVKSGACWTAHKAEELGKPAYWRII